jgi:antirestriction protein ArdC
MNQNDIYSKVTDQIISQLEKGVAPWRSPCLASAGLPRNFATGNFYQGANIFLLGMLRFQSPYFLTFLQAKQLGGHIRKGETGHLVIKCGTYEKEKENPQAGDEPTEKRRYLKGYTVFNACQIEGIEFPEEKHPERTHTEILEAAEAILKGMPNPPAIHEGRKPVPCYLKVADEVHMPNRATFRSDVDFFAALYHELTHYAAFRIMPRRST